MVAEELHQVLSALFLLNIGKLLQSCDKLLIEVIDGNLVVATIIHEILLAGHHQANELVVKYLIVRHDEVLKNLVEEGPVEAVAVTAQAADVFVALVQGIEAVLEFVLGILFLEDGQVHQVTDERSALINFFL